MFTVVKCIETSPLVCLVKDDHGEILEGTFYAEELQKLIKTDDMYKIETILKKRTKRDEKFSIWSSGLDIQSPSTVGSLNRTYKSEGSRFEVSVLRMAPSDTNSVSSWVTCGKKTPRSKVVFLCHVPILYTVIVVSIYNLMVESENFEDGTVEELFTILVT